MSLGPKTYFGCAELVPIGANYETNAYILQANQSFPFGQALGVITAATQNETQTITAPGSGTYLLQFLGATIATALAFNASDATIQAALRALSTINGANVTVASKVVTFMGSMAGKGQPLLVDPSAAATIARTTPGWTLNSLTPYSSTVVANPTVAPSLTLASTDGLWGIGAYIVSYTWVTAGGQSIPSPASVCAVLAGAATAHIAVGSITGIPNFVTSVNVYVNDVFCLNVAVSANATGAFNLLGPAATAALHTPLVSTAYPNSSGAQNFIGFSQIGPITTDQFGNISPSSNNSGDQQGSFMASLPVFVKGRFNASDLTGLDAAALVGRGTVEQGSITTGVVRLF